MRKHLVFALLGMVTMFASCSQEENLGSQSTDKVTSFTVAVDDGVKTRAVTEPTDKPTRYIMEVYEGTTSKDATQAARVVQDNGKFENVVLKDNQAYTILFWADYGTTQDSGNEYDTSDLRKVKVASSGATKVAFAKSIKFTVGTGGIPTDIVLEHAVAQVNFIQTGTLTAQPKKLRVSYYSSYSLNVEDYAATEIAASVAHTLDCNSVTTGTIATEYIFVSNEEGAVINIDATLDSETKKEISNAPFRRNYATNISGAYSDKYSATLKANCEGDWTGNSDKEIGK